MLRPLPVTRPAELTGSGTRNNCCVNSGLPDASTRCSRYPLFQHLQAQLAEFSDLAGVSGQHDGHAGPPAGRRPARCLRRPRTCPATTSAMLGVRPAAGRLLEPGDDRAGRAAGDGPELSDVGRSSSAPIRRSSARRFRRERHAGDAGRRRRARLLRRDRAAQSRRRLAAARTGAGDCAAPARRSSTRPARTGCTRSAASRRARTSTRDRRTRHAARCRRG